MTRFQLTLESTSSSQRAIHDLRAVLKGLLRRHGLRCRDAVELSTSGNLPEHLTPGAADQTAFGAEVEAVIFGRCQFIHGGLVHARDVESTKHKRKHKYRPITFTVVPVNEGGGP